MKVKNKQKVVESLEECIAHINNRTKKIAPKETPKPTKLVA